MNTTKRGAAKKGDVAVMTCEVTANMFKAIKAGRVGTAEIYGFHTLALVNVGFVSCCGKKIAVEMTAKKIATDWDGVVVSVRKTVSTPFASARRS